MLPARISEDLWNLVAPFLPLLQWTFRSSGKYNATLTRDDQAVKVGGVLLLGAALGVISVNAFHEKAGRSQGDSFWYLLVTQVLPRPSRRCRHPTIRTLRGALWFARCKLRVVVSAGSATRLSNSVPSRR